MDNVNLLLFAVLVLAVINVVMGYKKGMVKAIISLVSLVVLCVVGLLLANGISSYNDGKFFQVVLVIILLGVIGVAHHMLGIVFFSAKLVAKLPVVHSVDKLLGIVFGILETVLILWTVYTFVMMMDLGMVGQLIRTCAVENRFLAWMYQHNYLARGIEMFLSEFSFVPLSLP